MIEKIDRLTVFDRHRNITEEISVIQKALYDDDDDLFETETDKVEYQKMFDAKHLKFGKVKKYYMAIELDYHDLNTFPKVLSEKLMSLLSELDIQNLIVLPYYKRNFFGNLKIRDKFVKQAYNDLKKILGSFEYSEALKVDFLDFPSLINIAFWTQRIDASVPEFYFYDEKNKFAFFLCQFGKVHTIEFEKEILNDEILERHNFKELEERCFDSFSDNGVIKNRQASRSSD